MLRRRDVLDDTLILFLSDNGGCAEEINTQGWYDYILRGGERVSREFTLDGRPIQVGNDPGVMPGPDDTYQSYGLPWANVSNTPFRLYKALTHTGGVATPLIAHWPAGIPAAGELRDQPGHLIDIMPTLVELAGAAYPTDYAGEEIQPMEGVSLVPAFADRTPGSGSDLRGTRREPGRDGRHVESRGARGHRPVGALRHGTRPDRDTGSGHAPIR